MFSSCRSSLSWRRLFWTTSLTGTSFKPMTCPPSHFHVPPRTHSAGSSRVQPRGCRVRNPSKTFCQTAFRVFLPADVFCGSSTLLLLLFQTEAHIHTTQVKATRAHSSEQHLSVLLSLSNLHPCSLIAHPFLPCGVHVPVALHGFTALFVLFFFLFPRSQTPGAQLFGYDKCSTTSDKKSLNLLPFPL